MCELLLRFDVTLFLSILSDRCLPMNLRAEDLASGVLRDRVKVGASLADVDPMNLDTSVSLCVFILYYQLLDASLISIEEKDALWASICSCLFQCR